MSWLTASPWPILTLVLLGTGLLIFVAWYVEWRAKQAYVELVTHGEPAEATVLSARDTGWRTNGRPHIAFELDVRRQGRPPYQARARLQLARKWSPIPYAPGVVLRVRVDRDHPERVAIEGGEPVLGGARYTPPVLDLGDIAAKSFTIGTVSASNLYMVDGASYASPQEMPAEARATFEEAMSALTSAIGPAERLRELKRLYDEGLITADEYETKRAAMLEEL